MRSATVEEIKLDGNVRITGTGEKALKTAFAAVRATRPTVWLLGHPLPAVAGKLTVRRFLLERDGDHAIWFRVMEFLANGDVARGRRQQNRVRWL